MSCTYEAGQLLRHLSLLWRIWAQKVVVLEDSWQAQLATRFWQCSVGEAIPQKQGKLHQIKFLGANTSAGIVGGGSGAARWNGFSRA